MAKFMNNLLVLIILQISLVAVVTLSQEANDDRKIYIVYMGSLPEGNSITSDYHLDILKQVVHSNTAKEYLVRSYLKSFNGFAAKLTKKESEILKSFKEVVSVFPSRTLEPQTTRSWDFMGFSEKETTKNHSIASNVIIGLIDTGVWPESPSLNDHGFGPPPKKWKGHCNGGKNFTCNKKLIGAWTAFESARDNVGHGTHTASTAAGRVVDDVSFYGLAEGTARGAVPSARVATYKVCDVSSCAESDILAAFDEAIADGVDLISISIGGSRALEMYEDGIAIAAYHAMQKGILTVHSGGNLGNESSSVTSVAPWLLTVAASSTDRRILDKAVLGDGTKLVGNSINSFTLKGDQFPLVYGAIHSSSHHCSESDARLCSTDCLDEKLVKGKIVICNTASNDAIHEALKKGALGVFARTSSIDDVSMIEPMPAIKLKDHEFESLLSYYNSTKAPTAKILKSESVNNTFAPVVVSFSSRGPNIIALDILKPDITAPGIEILAGYSPFASVSDDSYDERKANYSILSGTSMSCPHVTGAAAYLKSIHPDWSPSAIKSAFMTTAIFMSAAGNPDAEFAYGSGHLYPLAALNPGLIYETNEDEYLTFFCKLEYTDKQISRISGNTTFTCPEKRDGGYYAKDVNYPTMSAYINTNMSFNIKFSRTVTNVGNATSKYISHLETYSLTSGVEFTVNPSTLSFTALNEKKSFEVTVSGKNFTLGSQVSASLVWFDGHHGVRSPIVVYSIKHPL